MPRVLYKTYKHIIGLQIRMQNVALSQQTKSRKHLLSVGSDGFQVYTYIPSKLLQYLTQINTRSDQQSYRRVLDSRVPQILEHHAEMPLVLKVSFKSDHMLLVFWVVRR